MNSGSGGRWYMTYLLNKLEREIYKNTRNREEIVRTMKKEVTQCAKSFKEENGGGSPSSTRRGRSKSYIPWLNRVAEEEIDSLEFILASSFGPGMWLSAQMTFITSKYHKNDSLIGISSFP
jgi:hypothetical protein